MINNSFSQIKMSQMLLIHRSISRKNVLDIRDIDHENRENRLDFRFQNF